MALFLVYIALYTLGCSDTASDYQIAFGTTWVNNKVFFALVYPKWYFYAIGTAFAVLYALFLYSIQKSRNLI